MRHQSQEQRGSAGASAQNAPREAILESLLKGQITPDDAQAEAARLGLGSLTDPEPESFDPMTETDWTIPMALAWIATRAFDRVRPMMDQFRAECFEFVPIHDGEGKQAGWYHRPARAKRGTLELACALVGEDEIAAAAKTLSDALAAPGKKPLRATAIPAIGGTRDIVAAEKWTALEVCDHKDTIYTRKKTVPCRYVHRDVLIARSELLAHWPAA